MIAIRFNVVSINNLFEQKRQGNPSWSWENHHILVFLFLARAFE